jgi:hypothetical protein
MVMKASAQPEIRTIPAGEFKAKCLKLMDEVVKGNLTLIVTKRGKPVMQATAPVTTAKPFVPLWGSTPNIQIHGDMMAPIFTDEELDSFGDPFLNV